MKKFILIAGFGNLISVASHGNDILHARRGQLNKTFAFERSLQAGSLVLHALNENLKNKFKNPCEGLQTNMVY